VPPAQTSPAPQHWLPHLFSGKQQKARKDSPAPPSMKQSSIELQQAEPDSPGQQASSHLSAEQILKERVSETMSLPPGKA
jgi:hypothetical protein